MRGMGNMQAMMRKMQKMQKDMMDAQEGLKDQTVEASVSGGLVTVLANGDGKILDIKIKEELVDPEDIDMLQDVVLTAVNEALEKSTKLKEDTLGKFTNGLNIPGL
ncbi:MAG: YbaB/EbfC family nucleoid-associated protein [Gemella sp.]|nr:YbaB/EbfC family nucleoid-associated protein [Gemella sp.]